MKRAIVTGATGAIGIALVNELIKNKVEVLVFSRLDSKRNGLIPQDESVSVKYCSLSELATVNNDTGKSYDVFFHLAWEGTSGHERDDLNLQFQNVKYTMDAIRAAHRFGCHSFIGAGSQAEYGRVEGKLKPDTPTHPENGYGIGKLFAGQITRELGRQIGVRHVWVRILSVYGPFDGEQSMVMSTIRKMKNGSIPQFTKGEQKWDYLYSGDAANALYLIGEKGIDGKTYVLGSGQARPLAEYIFEIRDVVNANAQLQMGAISYNEKQVMYLCADISDIQKDTGWNPTTTFIEGIQHTLKSINNSL